MSFVDSISDCSISMLDPSGLVTMWTAGAERINGYVASEMGGAHFSCFFPGPDAKAQCDRMLAEASTMGRSEANG